MSMRVWIVLIAVAIAATGGYYWWRESQNPAIPEGFASSNGRIEAVEIDVATKTPGRLESVKADEGDFVQAGDVLAQMDTAVLRAQLKEAQATLRQAESAIQTAKSTFLQRESEKAAADAVVSQREAELEFATANYRRLEGLVQKKAVSQEEFEGYREKYFIAQAAINAAKAHVAGAEAAIQTAKSQIIQAEANVESAKAVIERIQADIEDSTLRSPRDGRVQYRIAQPGEVLNAGGKVLNLVDLGDVYMTFFLPTAQAGRVKMGAEARIILDAAPQYVVPAHISYVSDVAQFTPKTVETAEERQKLMFRIKARIDQDVLKRYIRSVKTGLPGIAYVRLDERLSWPSNLQTRLPEIPE